MLAAPANSAWRAASLTSSIVTAMSVASVAETVMSPAMSRSAPVRTWAPVVLSTFTVTAPCETETTLASGAGAASRAGHDTVHGPTAKPAQHVKPGDDVRERIEGRARIVQVVRPIAKRVGAPVAEACYVDHSPPPPPRTERPATVAQRDRGAGRPTQRERRDLDKLKDGYRPYF